MDPEPSFWPDSIPLVSPRKTLLVLDTPQSTFLRCFVKATPLEPATSAEDVSASAVKIFNDLQTWENVGLKIEWLKVDMPPTHFERSVSPKDGIVRSSCRLGKTTVTRTVLIDGKEDAIFIHLHADQPGALSFRVIPGIADDSELRIENRREMIRLATVNQPESIGIHAWVIPFESDVSNDGRTITVLGEGEALILLTYGTGDDSSKPLAETLTRLGKQHDPGHFPPDPSQIWQGVLAAHLKTAENSP